MVLKGNLSDIKTVMKTAHVWKFYYLTAVKYTVNIINIIKMMIKIFKNLRCRGTNKSKVTVLEKCYE